MTDKNNSLLSYMYTIAPSMQVSEDEHAGDTTVILDNTYKALYD